MHTLITHLRHVDIAMPNFAEQRQFYTETWGLTETANDAEVSFLAAEGSPEQYVVRLRADAEKRTDLLAFGAATAADVDTLTARLIAQGVRLVHEPKPLDTPGGGYAVRFFDNEGRVVEVSADVTPRRHRRIEAREPVPVRLSHVLMNSPTPEATVAWYIRNLGFRLSDTMCLGSSREIMWFLRCNNFHHSFGIVRGPHAAFHHASFEMRGIDEYMRGTGRMRRLGIERLWGPGRHRAGDNSFSYYLDRAGNTVEYTTELEILDEDTWHPHLYDLRDPANADQWGTADEMNEFIAAKSHNDIDRGLFVAPPL
ncbi:glyoxalase/bleomycin resistance protein/dioxygenase superfamily protein [Nocardia tenerifensis]|uniref:Glyoxalase/bleomycin resistance protein/dioxygenase superfamily protein n=1 Tax=Nocardia tenerifensis TaxID=228006 RepID=A0A318JPX1_9NOCA|nr:VOC family protein [Nocardia tenerifensis]PXX54872.1 glyoxalase/bleomycin resistance protein/dioxygenase superfamily protein [Nocardia tenerifensis]